MSKGGYYVIGGLHRPDQIEGGFPEALDRLYSIFNKVVSLKNEYAPKIVYIGAAAGNPDVNREALRNNLQKRFPEGNYDAASHFVDLNLDTDRDAQVNLVRAALKDADVVYMDGGPNDEKLKRMIEHHGMLKEFKSFVASGGLVGGQSAGGIILADRFASWGDELSLKSGIGAIANLAIAAHIDDIEQREGRLAIIRDAKNDGIEDVDKFWGVSSGFAILCKEDGVVETLLPNGYHLVSSSVHDKEAELATVIDGEKFYAEPST